MSTRVSRTALWAGLFAALSLPALAADVDALQAQTTLPDPTSVVTAQAPALPAPTGLSTTGASAQVAVEGSSEPTRSAANLAAVRRARAARAASGGYYSNYTYRAAGPTIILGVRF
jgi:hypothetical protein